MRFENSFPTNVKCAPGVSQVGNVIHIQRHRQMSETSTSMDSTEALCDDKVLKNILNNSLSDITHSITFYHGIYANMPLERH